MNDARAGGEGPFKPASLLSLIAVFWTVGVVFSVVWNISQIRSQSLHLAVIQARTFFEKDIAYRRWILLHGGVYVPVTDETPPNPHLSHLPERDIVTPSGKRLTLMNSSYMMRQANEIARSEGGVLARIASVDPIYPGNRADAWETSALEQAKKGNGEIYGVEESNGQEYMRFVRTLIAEDSCMVCHKEPHNAKGDVLGGISISIPLGPFRSAERENYITLATAHGFLWLLGMGGIAFSWRRISQGEARRRKAEETLRESERRYRGIVEDQTELVCRYLPDGTFTFVNSAFCRYFGATEEELLGRKFWTELPGDAREEMEGYISSLSAKNPVDTIVHRVVDPGGGFRWQQWTDRAILDAEGNVVEIQGVGQDITERKKAQDALGETKEFLEKIIGSVTDPLFAKDSEHRFVLVNDAYCRLAGVKGEEEMIGKTGYDFFPAEQVDVFWENDDLVLQTGAENVNEEDLTCADGTRRTFVTKKNLYVDNSGNRFVVGIAREITERKAAEAALRESEERYRSLIESSPEAIVVHADGKFSYINVAGAKLLGASDPSELIGRDILDFVAPASVEIVRERIRSSREHGTKVPLVELGMIRLDGRAINVESVGMRIRYLGRPAMQVILRDATERRRMEEEKVKMEMQLRQAQKVEAIGTLAGGVAHDFNNILSAMFGYTEIALLSIPPGSPVRNHLEQVLKAGHRAKDLVRQILTYSRQCGDQERTPVDLGPIVKETVKFLRASLPATIEIRQGIADGPHIALAAPTQMHQVLLNLCTNALHAMEEKGGVLGINLDHIDLNGTGSRDYPDLKPGPYLKLTVSDTGSGMDPQTLERIFDPYFTTKEIGKGSGLGLAVVHGIVSHYEGSIRVRTERGAGSVFSVLLPRIERSVPFQIEVDRVLPNGIERILLVDDERTLARSGKRMLIQLGYKVSALADSRKALRLFAKKPHAFDVLITDYTMPGMTGEELVRQVHSIREDIPVILTSGFSELITEEKIKSLEIAEYLMKPVTMLEMSQTVRKVLDGVGRT